MENKFLKIDHLKRKVGQYGGDKYTTELCVKDIEKVEIRVNPYEYNYAGLACQGPFDSAGAALMSTPFCVALAAIDGQMTLKGLDRYDDPKIKEMIKKIEHGPDDTIPTYCCSITLTTKEGNSFNKESKEGAEYYNFDMEETIDLARRVTSDASVSQNKVSKMIDMARTFERAPQVNELTDLLGSCP